MASQQTVSEERELVTVLADEVVPGDQVRDQGILRQVSDVKASVVEFGIVFFFDPVDGQSDRLTVPLFQTVTAWRVRRD